MIRAAAIHLIMLTGPDGQHVELNPAEIVSLRMPRGSEHFARGIHCLVSTADGKFTTVRETCEEVRARLAE